MLNQDVKPESNPKVKKCEPGSTAKSRAKHRVTSEAEREIIIRMALAGKKPVEIAEFLGLKANTVYKFIRSRSAGWIAAKRSGATDPMRSPSASPEKKSAGRSKKR
ncbi:uncharacterized protein UTRI_00130 [Ustilago trichophora]|uniref:Uncharacterized protein n=1 Tax=Ustilago trichophora TaxID=86804 RepID=A0A5C3DQM4_9BASI|nr:uncharacterized protein UTRI_00130 [Ustilago trichophora]